MAAYHRYSLAQELCRRAIHLAERYAVHFGQGQRVVAGLGLRVAFSWVIADDSATGPMTTISIAGQHRAVGLPMRRGARTWDRQRFISSSLEF